MNVEPMMNQTSISTSTTSSSLSCASPTPSSSSSSSSMSSRRKTMKQYVALAAEITHQDWTKLGLDDPDHPNVAATSNLELTAERITALLLVRIIAIRQQQQEQDNNNNDNDDTSTILSFDNLSTTCLCETLSKNLDIQNYHRIDSIAPDTILIVQLRQFVLSILRGYNPVPYHNFEHAYQVFISCNKLLDVIFISTPKNHKKVLSLETNPIYSFAVLFAALIHDVEHQGVPNQQLVLEHDPLALQYNDQSVAEQRSLSIAFCALHQDKYTQLRNFLFPQSQDYHLFRRTVTDLVLATDIASSDRSALVKNKWIQAFGTANIPRNRIIHVDCKQRRRELISIPAPVLPPSKRDYPTSSKRNNNNKKKNNNNTSLDAWLEQGNRQSRKQQQRHTNFSVSADDTSSMVTAQSNMNESLVFWWFAPSSHSNKNMLQLTSSHHPYRQQQQQQQRQSRHQPRHKSNHSNDESFVTAREHMSFVGEESFFSHSFDSIAEFSQESKSTNKSSRNNSSNLLDDMMEESFCYDDSCTATTMDGAASIPTLPSFFENQNGKQVSQEDEQPIEDDGASQLNLLAPTRRVTRSNSFGRRGSGFRRRRGSGIRNRSNSDDRISSAPTTPATPSSNQSSSSSIGYVDLKEDVKAKTEQSPKKIMSGKRSKIRNKGVPITTTSAASTTPTATTNTISSSSSCTNEELMNELRTLMSMFKTNPTDLTTSLSTITMTDVSTIAGSSCSGVTSSHHSRYDGGNKNISTTTETNLNDQQQEQNDQVDLNDEQQIEIVDDKLCTMSLMEHILLASDVAHNMQGWALMLEFSHRLSEEIQLAIDTGRGGNVLVDKSVEQKTKEWFENQIAFLQGYVLPLAERLEQTGFVPQVIYHNKYQQDETPVPLLSTIVLENVSQWQKRGMEAVQLWNEEEEEEDDELHNSGEIHYDVDDDSIIVNENYDSNYLEKVQTEKTR